jgi:hypothetical protein
MKKVHPLVHHPFTLVHWWVLLPSGPDDVVVTLGFQNAKIPFGVRKRQSICPTENPKDKNTLFLSLQ